MCNCVNKPSYVVAEFVPGLHLKNCRISK